MMALPPSGYSKAFCNIIEHKKRSCPILKHQSTIAKILVVILVLALIVPMIFQYI
ncbi:hypothetical protein BLGI_4122 [Brevibacillus laterosporus GI-9]|nr:hypothetical protein BLGI_4122 [Brevibacillus laterosporus GI-9]